MATSGTFATALNCMDGRCQEKALAFVKDYTGADYIDSVTEPGIDGLLAGEHSVVSAADMPALVEWIRAKAAISAQGHGSTTVVIFGHCGCAGNTVDLDTHIAHLQKSKETVQSWNLFETVRAAVFDEAFELREV